VHKRQSVRSISEDFFHHALKNYFDRFIMIAIASNYQFIPFCGCDAIGVHSFRNGDVRPSIIAQDKNAIC
jgi:hypothetical protein